MIKSLEHLHNYLEDLGLTKREAQLYLFLLKNGPSTPTEIANKTGIKRPNIYDIAKGLIKEGLIHYQLVNKKRLIVAESPRQIADASAQKWRLAKELVPILMEFDGGSSFQSKVTFFEGKKSMQNLFFDGLKTKNKEIWYLWSPADMDKILGKQTIESFIQKRLKRKIVIRSLRPAEKESFYRFESDTQYGRSQTQVGYIPEKYTFSLSLAIYDDKTAFYSSKRESFGFLVESREFSQIMRLFYENLWDNSGKLTLPR